MPGAAMACAMAPWRPGAHTTPRLRLTLLQVCIFCGKRLKHFEGDGACVSIILVGRRWVGGSFLGMDKALKPSVDKTTTLVLLTVSNFLPPSNFIHMDVVIFHQILVPIAGGTEEMEAVIIIGVLRRAKAEVVVASVDDKKEIVASRNVKLVADMLLDEAVQKSYDLIVLPGGLGGAQAFQFSEKLVDLLKKQKESNRPYGAICASPALVLEPHGLLQGKKATAFPSMCNLLLDPSEAENRVVVDGYLATSRGPGTSMEFALVLVEKFFGRKKALELAKAMVFVS